MVLSGVVVSGLSAFVCFAGEPAACQSAEFSELSFRAGSPQRMEMGSTVCLVLDVSGETRIYDTSNDRFDFVGELGRGVTREVQFMGHHAAISYEDRTDIEIIDFTDPSAPVVAHTLSFTGSSTEFDLRDGLLYVAANEQGLFVYDLANPSVPLQAGHYGDIHAFDVVLDMADITGTQIMVSEMVEGMPIHTIYDVTDPANTVVSADDVLGLGTSEFWFDNAVADVFDAGFALFDTQSRSKLFVNWDNNLVQRDFTTADHRVWFTSEYYSDQSPVIPYAEGVSFNQSGSFNRQSYAIGDRVGAKVLAPNDRDLAIASSSGMYLFRNGLGLVDAEPTGNLFADIGLAGDSVIGAGNSWIFAYDVSEPAGPQRISAQQAASITYSIHSVKVADGITVMHGEENDGWQFPWFATIYETGNLSREPLRIGGLYAGRQIAVDGRRILANTGFGDSLKLYEVNDDFELEIITETSPDTVDMYHSLSMRGDLLLSLSANGTLRVFDLSSTGSITEVGELVSAATPFVGSTSVKMISENSAVINNRDELRVIDLTDPTSPSIATTLAIGDQIEGVKIDNGMLGVVSCMNGKSRVWSLDIVDVHDPINPVIAERVVDTDVQIMSFDLNDSRYAIQTRETLTVYDACSASPCAADLDGTGVLDFFDISAFLTAFSAQSPIADFTKDGLFDFFDVSQFIAEFGEGCP